MRDLGVDPGSDRVRRAIDRVRDRCTWGEEFGDAPFFEGEVEACINGRVLAAGAYFGEASDRLAERLLREQLSDGGWNCDAPQSRRSSLHTTICVLEGCGMRGARLTDWTHFDAPPELWLRVSEPLWACTVEKA